MRDYLLKFMNEDAAMGVQFLVALIAVLVLFGIFVWFLRLITGTQPKKRKARPDQRLAVLDRTAVDENRSLLLIQRDGVEHLLMIGGPSDVVVESNINLKTGDDGTDTQPKPGHEIARRVIAQRPFRTMSLAGSSAVVAESIGIVTKEAPEAVIAAPMVPAIKPQPIVKAVEPTQVISPEIIVAPAIEAKEQVAPDVVLDTAAEINPDPINASPRSAPEPTAATTTVQLSKTPAETPRMPVQQSVTAMEPTPVQPTPQPQQESAAPAYSHLDEQDILTNLEDALKIDMLPKETVQQSRHIQPAATRASERHQHDQDLEQNQLSNRQEVDLSAGFAAAMAGDATEQLREPQGPTISDTFLEDALAEALEVNTDTYSNEKNTVYSSSESVPTGSEGPSALRRTSHVDDEMNRLLDELATPSRG